MQRAERLGLGVSAAGHVLLFGALSLGYLASRPLILNAPPMEVDLVSEVALQSTTPKPTEAPPPPAATAPEQAPPEEPPPPPPEPAKPAEAPKPKPKPAPKPVPKAVEKPPAPDKPVAARPITTKAIGKPGARPAALALSDDIVKGAASERSPKPTTTPAVPAAVSAPFGPEQRKALQAAISRQLKPFWKAPPGAEDLITTLKWRLNPDGSLASGPDLVSQDGKSPINRLQQPLHVDAAMAAVRAAAPFNLPAEFYDYWKNITSFKFDKRL